MILKLLYNKVKMELIELEVQTKQCTKCKETKSFNEFYKNKVNQFGLSSYCKQCNRVCAKQWKEDNREKKRLHNKKWKEKNKEKFNNGIRKWVERNPNYIKVKDKLIRFIKKYKIKEKLLIIQNNKCLSCNKKMLSNSNILEPIIEHWIPRSKDGLNHIDNIYLVCKSCNSKKYNYLPEDFYGNKYNKINEKRLEIIKQLKKELDYENNRIIFDCLI